ncbi:MAG: GNAT family N-acetyltransferase [Sphingomicrobium sp.]
MSDTDLFLRPLTPADAAIAAGLLADQPADYLKYFHPFGADEMTIAETLGARDRDVYSGLFLGGALICIFMLRGWDAGFTIPSFGLVVAANRRGREVLTVALEAAKLTARLAGAERIMCKVHPENLAGTRGALRLGFVPASQEPDTGNVVYYLDLQA